MMGTKKSLATNTTYEYFYDETIGDCDDDDDDEHDDDCFVRVSEDLPSLGDCREFVKDPSCGAVATYTGSTRGGDFRAGRNATCCRLGYECDD